MADLTPYQTVGPFFHEALPFAGGGVLRGDRTAGHAILIEGTICDGAGRVVPDALIEVWQANAAGRYNHPADTGAAPLDSTFDGFGRLPTDGLGQFSFDTIKPGHVPGPGGRMQAPHVQVSVLGRGIQTRLVTRIYFEDEAANADDPILQLVPAPRRHTLIARLESIGRYRFDIRLQGQDETVFFDV